ncbi:hypothetical protein [Janibacter melonis]|uniref:hypothetical protein n=1 Tax=Janibacter melonis TaxID=262209 RepID=UPI00191930EC|nr:hypothetical protein [Janibacter melonis]
MALTDEYVQTLTVRLSDGYLMEFGTPTGYDGIAWAAERGALKVRALKRDEAENKFESGPLIGEVAQGHWLAAWRG